ncbi:Hypothetical predicted protein [Pelobates cultripes]|uniref:Uncharacterized protein n=1 Tax=Pelobates cultripes TaxID=61616 RepID=A0AAD1SZB5_PELCU|nr:Hypothetical predicted protein [Pelobates cultripes]
MAAVRLEWSPIAAPTKWPPRSRACAQGANGRSDLAAMREIQDGRCAHSGPMEAYSTAQKPGKNGAKYADRNPGQ